MMGNMASEMQCIVDAIESDPAVLETVPEKLLRQRKEYVLAMNVFIESMESGIVTDFIHPKGDDGR